jgi:rhamnosyltransferase
MCPNVSIIVPTRNGGVQFEELLDRVSLQKAAYTPELVIVDSGSSDGTVECARRHGAKIIAIDPATFNHGETRNLGIRESRGDICVLLVQDALPISELWLEAMVKRFEEDPLICGVTTRQIPRPDTDLVTRWEVVTHNQYLGDEPQVRSISDWNAFERLSMQERFFLCNFDNVCSAVRRSTWEMHLFRAVPFAEDLDWGVRVLEHGHKIAYEPGGGVIHSHLRSALYHLRRQYVSAKVVPEILRCPINDIFANSDGPLFGYMNPIVNDAFSLAMLVEEFAHEMSLSGCRRLFNEVQMQGIDATAGVEPCDSRRPKASNPIRAHFFYLIAKILETMNEIDMYTFRHLVVHCAARSIGGFLGTYYLWSERNGTVSPELRRLDLCLRAGV